MNPRAAWQATPAWWRALAVAATGFVLALLLHRPDLIALTSPFALAAALDFRRPQSRPPRATTDVTPSLLREGESVLITHHHPHPADGLLTISVDQPKVTSTRHARQCPRARPPHEKPPPPGASTPPHHASPIAPPPGPDGACASHHRNPAATSSCPLDPDHAAYPSRGQPGLELVPTRGCAAEMGWTTRGYATSTPVRVPVESTGPPPSEPAG